MYANKVKKIAAVHDLSGMGRNFVFTATGFRDLFTLITKANNPVTFRKTPKDLRRRN